MEGDKPGAYATQNRIIAGWNSARGIFLLSGLIG